MKIFLVILISFGFSFNLLADEVLVLKGQYRDVSFQKDIREITSIKNNQEVKVYRDIFGRNYISNNTIIIKFKNKVDIDSFSKKYKLKYLRKNNTGSYVFQNISDINILEKSNQIFELDFVENVSPNWIRKRKLF
jgi:hypothetical protein